MSEILRDLLFVISLLLLLPSVLLFIEVALALFPVRDIPPSLARPRLAVLVPAHNESFGIGSTLRSILRQLRAGDRLLVIADNCTDDTARVAAIAGAEVIERNDDSHRGKGYALDFGIRHLDRHPPQIVIIVDADCMVAPGAIERLACASNSTGRPVQALYLMDSPHPADNALGRIMEFAWIVKNQVRPLGLRCINMPCQLMGTGMAFPWSAIRAADLANGHLVEDMKLGLELARAGSPPLFSPDALVTSQFPPSVVGVAEQRTRWEHGHLTMISSAAGGYLAAAIADRNLPLLAMVADLCIPPLALQTTVLSVACFLGAGAFVISGDARPLIASLAAWALLVGAILLAWRRFGRHALPLSALVQTPFYVAAKLPLYFRYLVDRQVEWVRSKRN